MKLFFSYIGTVAILFSAFSGYAQKDARKSKGKTSPSKDVRQQAARKQYGIGSAFPDFEYFDIEKEKHSSRDILGKELTFLILFNPTCTHCIESGKLFHENQAAFEHVRVFYLAGEGMLPYLEDFYKETGLQKTGPVDIGVDNSGITYKLFLYRNLPQINVYNKDGELIDQMTGEAVLTQVLRYKREK